MKNLSNKTHKSKKDHICNYCLQKIDKGEIYNSQTNIFDDQIYTWKSHRSCDKIASILNMHDDMEEGLNDQDFQMFINDKFSEINNDPIKYPFSKRLDIVKKHYKVQNKE